LFRYTQSRHAGVAARCQHYWFHVLLLSVISIGHCCAQNSVQTTNQQSRKKNSQINVNWLYGAYVPSDVPMKPLTNDERRRLYVRQTFTTPGIYIKTAFFSMRDQAANSPPEWGGGFEGYGKRVLSRQAQFIIQNSFAAAGNAAVGWEPRYDRCRCAGFWSRTAHALKRNFVTYDRTGKSLRPQLMPYAAAFGAGAIAATWQPGHPDSMVRGYQGAIAQAGVGIGTNWISEFAPEVFGIFRRKHKQ
jgi:hypothetical protein